MEEISCLTTLSVTEIPVSDTVQWEIFTGPNFHEKSRFPPRRNFRGFNFRVQRQHELLTTPFYCHRANRGQKISHERRQDVVCQFEIARQCRRQIERDYIAHKTHVRNFHESKCSCKSSHAQSFTVTLQFLFSRFGHGSRKLRKFGPRVKFTAIQYCCPGILGN